MVTLTTALEKFLANYRIVVGIDAIRQNVNNNQDLNNADHMQNSAAPNIVFVDEQDIANVRQSIVDDEDHESEIESDKSIEVQPRASKRP